MIAEAHDEVAELPLDPAGVRLRRAREAVGLSRADIASRTKIAERHIGSLEDGNYGALASRTYAIGFSRSYARAVGLDEYVIAKTVRRELGDMPSADERRAESAFEPGDPARVPSAKLAWIAALGALAVIAVTWFLWRSYYAPGVELPDLAAPKPAAVPGAAGPVAAVPGAAPQTAAGAPGQIQGQVVFTSLEPGIWVKFYDNTGKQLMQKQMAQGESYALPADAAGPLIWTGRPEVLQITVGGKPVPKLSEKQATMKDVPVSAAALLARPAPALVPASPAAPAPAPQASTVSE
jgi:cytoskeleton protein RodZ